MLKYILSSLLFLFPVVCSGADYYLDNAATGANDGSSWTDAYESWPDVSWAAVGAGDTLYVSGGVTSKTYNITAYIEPTSGTDGNNTVIGVGQDEGHNGVVIIDGGDVSYSIFHMQYKDYVTIDGEVGGERHMRLQNWGDGVIYGDTNHRKGAINGFGANAGVDGCLFRYLDIINDDTSCASEDCEAGFDIEYKGGILLTGASDQGTVIEYNYVEGAIRKAIVIGDSLATAYAVNTVRFNEIKGFRDHEGRGGPDGISSIGGTDVHDNIVYHEELLNAEWNRGEISVAHIAEDGIQSQNSHTRIYNNIVYGISQGAIRTDSYTATNILIYNNLLYKTHTSILVPTQRGIELDGDVFTNVHVLNNTIVGYGTRGISISTQYSEDVFITVQNNLLYDADLDLTTKGGNQDDMVYSYNVFVKNDGSEGHSDLVQSYNPYDSEKSVEFISYTANTVDNDFRLTAGSDMAINTGVTTALLTDDINGISRPQGAAYDIGAYEYILGNTGQTQAGTGAFTIGTGSLTTQ